MKYYNISKNKVLEEFHSNINGLTSLDASKRLRKYGYNELPKKKKDRTNVLSKTIFILNKRITS